MPCKDPAASQLLANKGRLPALWTRRWWYRWVDSLCQSMGPKVPLELVTSTHEDGASTGLADAVLPQRDDIGRDQPKPLQAPRLTDHSFSSTVPLEPSLAN